MRARLLAFGTLAALVALLFARPHATPGPPMRDFEAYYAGGIVWNAGGDPYSQAIWDAEKQLPGVDARRYEALPFVDPPATLPLFGLLARMPFAASNLVWRSLLFACLALIAVLALFLMGRRITLPSLIAIAVTAAGFGPLTSALALGQLALPAALVTALALFMPAAGFFAWIQPNIAVAQCAQAFSRRGAIPFAANLTLFGIACTFVLGTRGIARYVAVLNYHRLAEQFSAIQVTPAAIAYGFGAAPSTANAAGVAVALAAASVWLVILLRLDDAIARFCATCALLPLMMPFFHEHSLLIVFFPAVVYALRADSRVQPLAMLGALLVATDWLGLAQRPDGTLQTLLLVAGCGCGILALHDRPRPRMLLVPLALLAAIGVASIFAHAHPSPVWPDAMGALPPNIARMDIASAWHAQQDAAGLLQQNPVWAALRMLSLLGCALTVSAIALSSRYPARSEVSSPAPA
jgi:hypothetical protein